jgi:hypothetical protein
LDTAHRVREDARARQAISVARSFIGGIITNVSADSLSSFCAIPFCQDDSTVLTTRQQLRSFFASLLPDFAASAKKNNPRLDSAFIYGVEKGVVTGLIPVNTYLAVVRIKFSVNGTEPVNQFIVAVQMGDEPKIVGISN